MEGSGLCALDTLMRVAQVLGLDGELEPLFALQVQSIAQMRQAAACSSANAPAVAPNLRSLCITLFGCWRSVIGMGY